MSVRGAVRKLAMRLRGFHDPAALRRQGLRLGRDVHIGPWTIIDPSHCWLIDIEDEVVIAPRVHILAHDASTDIHLRYAKIGRVRIGRRAFVGAGSIILPGTTIGDDAIIGAGSVVSARSPPVRSRRETQPASSERPPTTCVGSASRWSAARSTSGPGRTHGGHGHHG